MNTSPTIAVKHYPAFVFLRADSVEELRARFPNSMDFKDFAAKLETAGCTSFHTPASEAQNALGIAVKLPDGKYALCFAFEEHMRDTHDEAVALADLLTADGSEFAGHDALLMTVRV